MLKRGASSSAGNNNNNNVGVMLMDACHALAFHGCHVFHIVTAASSCAALLKFYLSTETCSTSTHILLPSACNKMVRAFRKLWELLSQKSFGSFRYSYVQDSRNSSECSEKLMDASQLRCAFKLLDSDFLNERKVLEIANGATEFNIPVIKANRKLVASENGGLQNPSVLVFNPDWGSEQAQEANKRFNYPSISDMQKPKNEEDIALSASTNKQQFLTGMVPFAIGSETAGSMTYPGARCSVTALRPTLGTLGRTGVMSISESLDKLGPFCRSASDCAIILDAIRGKDPDDLSSRDIPFNDPFSVNITKLTVGYLEDAEMEVVQVLEAKGVKMVPFKLNYTVDSVQGILNFTMVVDMLAHFDEWQRSGQDDVYEAPDQWPLELRCARVIPAVDYVQAQRARGKLIREVKESFTVNAFIGDVTDWEKVCLGNLVGLPVIVVPVGFKSISNPPSSGSLSMPSLGM